MTSLIEIYNSALIYLGQDTVTNINDVKTINAIYENTVRELLTRNTLAFSIVDVDLMPTSNPKEYDLPHDFLYLICLNNSHQKAKDQFGKLIVEGGRGDNLSIKYIKRVAEEYFPPFFVTLLSLALARKVSLNYNVRQEVLQLLEQRYIESLKSIDEHTYRFTDFSGTFFL